MASYEMKLLGHPVLNGPTGTVTVPPGRAQALVWACAANPMRKFQRAELANWLWDDCTEMTGRTRLRNTLSRLRAALPVWPFQTAEDWIGWSSSANVTVDAARFLALVQPGVDLDQADPASLQDDLAAAISLVRGPFLDGFLVRGCVGIEEWLEQERHAWDLRVQRVFSRLLKLEESLADWSSLLRHAEQATRIAPYNEAFHRSLMLAHYQTGDRAQAIATFATAARLLYAELGVQPDPSSVALRDAIAAGTLPRTSIARGPAAVPAVRPPKGAPAPLRVPMVGREALLQELQTYMVSDTGKLSSVVLLYGEPGVGKTRLMHALEQRLRDQATKPHVRTVLRAHGFLTRTGQPYAFFAGAIHALLADLDLAQLDLPDPWLAQVQRVVPAIADIRPDLPGKLGHFDQSKPLLFEGIARFLAALPSPGLFLMEDLHWADSESIELLAYLVRHRPVPGLTFLATARAGELTDDGERLLRELENKGYLRWLDVAGLDPVAVRSLVAAMTGHADDALGSRLHSQTSGNPLFIVEILRDMKDGSAPAVPVSVQSTILNRVARLPESARHVLDAASVFATDLPLSILQEVSALDEHVIAPALEGLVRGGFLAEPSRRSTETPSLRFGHELIRFTVEAQLRPSVRIALHRRAFNALARDRKPNSPLSLLERLAYHAMEGEMWGEGLQMSRDAAVASLAVYAYHAAIPLLEQALECLRHMPLTPGHRLMAVDIRLMMGQVSVYSHPDRQKEWARPALDEAEAMGDHVRAAKAAIVMAGAYIYGGELHEALATLQRVLSAARAIGDPILLTHVLRYTAHTLVQRGMYAEAEAILSEAIPMQDQYSIHLDSVTIRVTGATLKALQGNPGPAKADLQILAQKSVGAGDLGAAAHANFALAVVAALQGDWAVTISASRLGATQAARSVHPLHEYLCSVYLGLAIAYMGDVTAGIGALEASIANGHRLKTRMLIHHAYANLAEACLLAGQIDRAEAAGQTGLEIAKASGTPYTEAKCLLLLGLCRAAAGRRDEAVSHLDRAYALFASLNALPGIARAHAALARYAHGEAVRAEHRRQAEGLLQQMGMVWDLAELRSHST